MEETSPPLPDPPLRPSDFSKVFLNVFDDAKGAARVWAQMRNFEPKLRNYKNHCHFSLFYKEASKLEGVPLIYFIANLPDGDIVITSEAKTGQVTGPTLENVWYQREEGSLNLRAIKQLTKEGLQFKKEYHAKRLCSNCRKEGSEMSCEECGKFYFCSQECSEKALKEFAHVHNRK